MLENWLRPGSYRVKQLEKIAKNSSLSFSPIDEFGLINLLKDFRLFQKGGRKRIGNILNEKTELHESDFRIFDYQYTVSSGKHSRTFKQTVFFVQSKQLALPQFYMQPEHFFNKVGNYLGIEDIDFVEFPQFSDQYWLKGKDEWQIRQSMNDDLLHFFSIEQDWSLEGLNYYMIFYQKNKILPTTEILDFYKKGKHIVDMFSKS